MKFSDEMISAYADGELEGSEKAEFEAALKHDVELQRALSDIHELKTQLQQAYQELKPPVQQAEKTGSYRMLAYASFLFVAFTTGWISSDLMHPRSATESADLFAQGVRAVEQKPGKYILHISKRDEKKFRKTLQEAEALLSHYQGKRKDIELEIIANAGGLDLFRSGATPYTEQVRQLAEHYPNIKLIACANAIERLREKGIEPDLINAVHQGPVTAIDQVVKRINEGWTYIKI